MSTPTTQNPFSLAYGLIFKAAQNWPAMAVLVPPGNFAAGNLQAPGFRYRQNAQAVDRVQFTLTEKRIGAKPFSADATNATFTCLYTWEFDSGQMSIDKANLVVAVWYQSLVAAGPFLGLEAGGVIQKWELADGVMTPRDKTAARPDWTVVGGVLVTFAMNRTQFLAASFT